MTKYVGPYDKSEQQCQPCDNFRPESDYLYGYREHDCYSEISGTVGERCCSLVSFCENCHTDHHKHGYNSCKGFWHNGSGAQPLCRQAHPECMKKSDDLAQPQYNLVPCSAARSGLNAVRSMDGRNCASIT